MRRNPNHPPVARARGARALAAVIAAGKLTGGVAFILLASAAGWITPGNAAETAANTAASAAPATAKTPETAAKPATAKPAAPTAKTAASSASPATSPAAVKPAAPAPKSAKSVAKSAAAMPGAVVQSEHLDDQVAYQYNALGRRDPFQPLMGGEYVGADVGGDAPPDVGGLKVVGIVWGDADQFALVEDARGDSHIMRRGDKVTNGYVESLKRDAMIVNLTLDGQSQTVRVPLTRKGDKSNASR
jgi:hypothetical protein